jgi:hypothetical protein
MTDSMEHRGEVPDDIIHDGNAWDVFDIIQDTSEADLLRHIAKTEGANGIYMYFALHPATDAAYNSSYVVAALIQQGLRTMSWHAICHFLGGESNSGRIDWDGHPSPDYLPVVAAALEEAEQKPWVALDPVEGM